MFGRKGMLDDRRRLCRRLLPDRSRRSRSPDVQIHFIIFSAEKLGAKLHPFPGFTVSVCQLRPESRGTVRIKSADPARGAGDPAELPFGAARPRHHGRRHEAAAQDHGAAGDAPLHRRGTQSRPALRQRRRTCSPMLRETGTTIFHPTSTCRMGSDPKAVVDERLRVRGIERLRVDRRLDHADGGVRQHQCRHRHDRRKRRRHDLAGCARCSMPRAA